MGTVELVSDWLILWFDRENNDKRVHPLAHTMRTLSEAESEGTIERLDCGDRLRSILDQKREMWQEMRKHEKKLRGMIVDYKRRSERRKEYYERIVRSLLIRLSSSFLLFSDRNVIRPSFFKSGADPLASISIQPSLPLLNPHCRALLHPDDFSECRHSVLSSILERLGATMKQQ